MRKAVKIVCDAYTLHILDLSPTKLYTVFSPTTAQAMHQDDCRLARMRVPKTPGGLYASAHEIAQELFDGNMDAFHAWEEFNRRHQSNPRPPIERVANAALCPGILHTKKTSGGTTGKMGDIKQSSLHSRRKKKSNQPG